MAKINTTKATNAVASESSMKAKNQNTNNTNNSIPTKTNNNVVDSKKIQDAKNTASNKTKSAVNSIKEKAVAAINNAKSAVESKINDVKNQVADLKSKAEALKSLNPAGFQNTIISKMGSLSSVGGAISQMANMVQSVDTTKFPGNIKLANQISTSAEFMGNVGKSAAGGKTETKFADRQKELEKQVAKMQEAISALDGVKDKLKGTLKL